MGKSMESALYEWKGVIASVAAGTTVIQFLSGVLVCKKYIINKTTSESSCLPFTCGFLSCALWMRYGLIKEDDVIILVNLTGIVLQLLYLLVFYYYTLKKSNVVRQFFTVSTFLFLFTVYSFYETNAATLVHRLGLLACGVTLLFIGAPLTKLYYVFKVKNTECLPFPMIVMAIIVSSLWFLYGIIIEDPFLQVPNFIGFLLATLQLIPFLIFPSTSKPTYVKVTNA